MITAWEPCHRPWGNAKCPCLHSDPKFPDCAPGATQRLRGWLALAKDGDLLVCHPSAGWPVHAALPAARCREFAVLAGAEAGALLQETDVLVQPLAREHA